MDSLSFVVRSSRRPRFDDENRFFRALVVVQIHSLVPVAFRYVMLPCVVALLDLPSVASALVEVRLGEPGLALEPHRELDRKVQLWALPLLRLLRHRGGRRDGRALDPSPLQLIFQWFLPNPWVNAPFFYASLWSETVFAASE